MAEENIDDVLMRLGEIEKLQVGLRHLVPPVNSSGHRDLSRNSSTSIRFPSLFTFPVISNLSSTTSSKNERVQKSTAQMNLNNGLPSDGRASKKGLSTKEANIFKDLLKSTSNVAKSYGKKSLASTSSAATSKTAIMPYLTKSTVNQPIRNSQKIMKKELKSERSTTATSRTRNTIDGKSNTRSRKETNANSNIGHSTLRGKNSEIKTHVVVPITKKKK